MHVIEIPVDEVLGVLLHLVEQVSISADWAAQNSGSSVGCVGHSWNKLAHAYEILVRLINLVADAKCDIGCASTPTLGNPSFLHSTTVVPVPQKGSRTHASAANSNRLMYSRTKCGGNESTNRYQSCAARSLASNRLDSPRETGNFGGN